jgi:hypothetical protein
MLSERTRIIRSTGLALKSDLDQMLAEPFEAFTFSPAGAAVYQRASATVSMRVAA